MSELLRKPLVALVFLNVAMVHLTDAVTTQLLVPLYLLTLAAPWLSRLRQGCVYRMVWNAGILVAFTSLGLRAQSSGIVHLLEDGLLLAALCQVHLLNNLGKDQRPDLLFFNSFLIAFVTAFFCQDIEFSIAFAAYVAFLVPSLQLYAAVRSGGDHEVDRAERRAIVRDSIPRTAIALVLTIAVFLFWPRDFEREGFVGESRQLTSAMRNAMGFGDQVSPERGGNSAVSDRVLATVHLEQGRSGDVPLLWRTGTFLNYRNGTWLHEVGDRHRSGFDLPWRRQGNQLTRGGQDARSTVEVRIVDKSLRWIPAPASATSFALVGDRRLSAVAGRSDATLRYDDFDHDQGKLRYTLSLAAQPPHWLGLQWPNRRQLMTLPQRGLPTRLRTMADEWRAALPADASAADIATALTDRFRDEWEYALPGAPGAASDLRAFLRGAPGHCEYYATAVTLMLRHLRVPARLATGILAQEWNDDGSMLTLRERHAHAWVEVWDDDQGWLSVDPTPASMAAEPEPTWWGQFRDGIEELWQTVAGFDDEARADAWAWLLQSPGRVTAWVGRNPFGSAGIVLAVAGLVVWRRRRLGPQPVRALQKALRRAGIDVRPQETPREVLARARRSAVPDERLDTLAAAVHAHEMRRYGATCDR